MRAIILAAGVGQRLGAAAEGRPKCLLRFGGKSLLAWHLELLHGLGVTDVVLVLGYRGEDVKRELDALGVEPRPATLANPDYEQGSVRSLWVARRELAAGDDVLLMDADVLYDRGILERLAGASGNVFLLDRDLDDTGGEAVKLCVRNGALVEFRKAPAPGLAHDTAGESVGFFRFEPAMAARLAARCEHYVASDRAGEPHEEALRDLLLESPEAFGFEDVTGLPWIEIDFPDDLKKAESDVLPRLSQLGQS